MFYFSLQLINMTNNSIIHFSIGVRDMGIHSEGRIEGLKCFRMEDLTFFNFGKVATATNNFHSENKLGQGGFGLVYKVI